MKDINLLTEDEIFLIFLHDIKSSFQVGQSYTEEEICTAINDKLSKYPDPRKIIDRIEKLINHG